MKMRAMKINHKDSDKNNSALSFTNKPIIEDDDEPISKTKLKAEADALQVLGVRLVELTKDKLAKLDLPEILFDAIYEAKRLTANGAIRRQKQYIGSLMRDIDTAHIVDQMHRWEGKHTAENAHFHMLERWRDRMIESPDVVAEWMKLHPHTDSQQLRTLIRNVQREMAANKPPKSTRELFKLIREITETDAKSAQEANVDDANTDEIYANRADHVADN